MAEQSRGYLAYMLRLWQVKNHRVWQWRAMLENAHTNESCGFASLDDLFDYLRGITGAMPGPEGTGLHRKGDETT